MAAIVLTLELDHKVSTTIQTDDRFGRQEVRKDISTPAIRARMMLTNDSFQDVPILEPATLTVEMQLQTLPEMTPSEMNEWLRKVLIRLLQTPSEKCLPAQP